MKLDIENYSFECRLRNTLKFLLAIAFLGYLIFIPVGPYPIYVFGLKLDHIFILLAFLVSILLFPMRWPKGTKPILASILFFLAVSFVSMALSDSDLSISKTKFAETLIYVTVTLVIPVLLYKDTRLIRYFIVITALFAGVLVLYKYFFAHYGDFARMQLGTLPRGSFAFVLHGGIRVDPNITAVGLLLCVVIFLHDFSEGRGKPFDLFSIILFSTTIMVVTWAVFLLSSRTATISFIVSIFWGTVYVVVFKRTSKKRILAKIGILGLAVIIAMAAFSYKQPEKATAFCNRITRLATSEWAPAEFVRFDLANKSIERWLQNPKTFFIGQGYCTTNPHNEFLRMLSGSGLLGLISFLLIFISVYITCCTSKTSTTPYLFSQNALFAYLFCSIQFYGHTKTMWAALMFLLMNFYWQKYSEVKITERYEPKVNSSSS